MYLAPGRCFYWVITPLAHTPVRSFLKSLLGVCHHLHDNAVSTEILKFFPTCGAKRYSDF